jgi:hypothetical protein
VQRYRNEYAGLGPALYQALNQQARTIWWWRKRHEQAGCPPLKFQEFKEKVRRQETVPVNITGPKGVKRVFLRCDIREPATEKSHRAIRSAYEFQFGTGA